mmetsp:Transcript_19469/g.34728  ORF Transcript_19469/g.34728 Transcript_19469/m.34728 type:complete len:233 (+) Transcript_19469:298-996(+)
MTSHELRAPRLPIEEQVAPPPPPLMIHRSPPEEQPYDPTDYAQHGKPPLTVFLQKLLEITQVCDPEIACWDAEGTTFRIKKSEEFQRILKKRFKGNTNTFVRQLHFYGFRKLETDDFGRWGFQHRYFVRDRPELVHQIRRKTKRKFTGTPTPPQPTGTSLNSDEPEIDGDDVAELRSEVEDLKVQLENLTEGLALMRDDLASLKASTTITGSGDEIGGSSRVTRKRKRILKT